MGKHIHRITKEGDATKKHYNKDPSSEDEWSHVTEIDSKKTPDSDPMSPQARFITFTNKFANATKEELVKEKSARFKDQVTNTDQYLRFVNGLMKEKVNRLRRLTDNEKKFQDEASMLQNKIKSQYELNKINPKNMTSDDAKALLFHLEEEYERMKDRLLYQELIVQRTKDEIAAKRKQIQQIKEELKHLLHTNSQEEVNDPIIFLRKELKKAGISESSRIFQALDEIAEYLDLKDTEKNQP